MATFLSFFFSFFLLPPTKFQWQGAWVQSLAGEDSMYCRAAKPVRYNHRSLCALQPMLCNKRSHRREKPVDCS